MEVAGTEPAPLSSLHQGYGRIIVRRVTVFPVGNYDSQLGIPLHRHETNAWLRHDSSQGNRWGTAPSSSSQENPSICSIEASWGTGLSQIRRSMGVLWSPATFVSNETVPKKWYRSPLLGLCRTIEPVHGARSNVRRILRTRGGINRRSRTTMGA